MGQPGWSKSQSFPHEHIVRVKETRGTETSKYPQEEKEKSIPKVAASEQGRAQTGLSGPGLRTPVNRRMHSRMDWKVQPKRVKVLYAKCISEAEYPE